MSSSREIETFAVLGAGVMGAGIAEIFANRGYEVRVFDPRMEVATAVVESLASKQATVASCIEDAVRDVTIVVEAVTEDILVKLRLFQAVETFNKKAIIASNTSTFMPSRLTVGLDDPSRLVIAHFFNPASIIPLVEVVPSVQTDPMVIERIVKVLSDVGKQPVVLQRETEGFIANRLQAALVREALSLWRDGVADPETIDAVVTGGLGPRWAVAGPFQVMDMGGLDVWRTLTRELFPVLGNATSTPVEIENLIDLGHLGAKSGVGFYSHNSGTNTRLIERIREIIALKTKTEM